MNWFIWVGVAINLGCAAYYSFTSWRLHRTLRHAQMFDHLLTQMAILSFTNQHMPLWKAWSGVMGSFDVDFKVTRFAPKAD